MTRKGRKQFSGRITDVCGLGFSIGFRMIFQGSILGIHRLVRKILGFRVLFLALGLGFGPSGAFGGYGPL